MANDFQKERGESSKSTSKYIKGFTNFLMDAAGCRIESGYSDDSICVKMRPALIAYATKYTEGEESLHVPVLAATIEYADLYLSRKKKIPVVVPNGSVKLHFQLFVIACAIHALQDYDEFHARFTKKMFVEKHNVADRWDIYEMADKILEGLHEVKLPLTSPWDGFDDFYEMVTRDMDVCLPRITIWEILVAIRRDIRFTEFGQPTLIAAAILVTFLKFQPEQYISFSKRFFELYHQYFDEREVKRCFCSMDGHFIPEEVFARPGKPRLVRDIPDDNERDIPDGRRRKGKELMYPEFSVGDASEKWEKWEGYDIGYVCEKFTEFDDDWLEVWNPLDYPLIPPLPLIPLE